MIKTWIIEINYLLYRKRYGKRKPYRQQIIRRTE